MSGNEGVTQPAHATQMVHGEHLDASIPTLRGK